MLSKLIENKNSYLKLERLYEQYKYLMYAEAYRILQDRHLAEDAVQQSFMKIIKNLHKIDEITCPRTRNFMVIICVNVAKNIYNKRSLLNKQENMLQEIDIDTIKVENDTLNIVINKESIKQITQAIETLDPKYRDILLLKRVYGYSREEIAEQLQISLETVKKRLTRGIKMLLNILENEGFK